MFDDQDLHLISFPEGFTAITSRVFYTNRAFLRAGQIPIHSVGFPTYRKPLCVFTLITRNAATHAIEESVNGGAPQQNGLPRRSFVIITILLLGTVAIITIIVTFIKQHIIPHHRDDNDIDHDISQSCKNVQTVQTSWC